MYFLKLVYIKIYSEGNYLKKLDNEIRDHIKFHYPNSFDDTTRIIDIRDEKVPIMIYPNIENVLNKEMKTDFLLESSYIIS